MAIKIAAQKKLDCLVIDGIIIPGANLAPLDDKQIDTLSGQMTVTLLAHESIKLHFNEGWMKRDD